jgi:hypothetical protein
VQQSVAIVGSAHYLSPEQGRSGTLSEVAIGWGETASRKRVSDDAEGPLQARRSGGIPRKSGGNPARVEFFRKGGQMRGLVKGKRWLLLSRWMNLSESKRQELNHLFAMNRKVFKAYLLEESLDRLWLKWFQ